MVARIVALLSLFATVLVGADSASSGPAWAAQPVDLQTIVQVAEQVPIGHTAVINMQVRASSAEALASTVRVVLTLPDGVSYISDEPGAVGCTTRPGEPTCFRNSGPCLTDSTRTVVTCMVTEPDDIHLGYYSYTATVAIAGDIAPGTKLTFSATAKSDGDERTPENNTATAPTTAVLGADLGVKAIPPEGSQIAGQPLRYTVVVHNYGPAPVSHFELFEYFEGKWYIGAESPTEGTDCSADPGEFVCYVHRTLAPGEELRIEHVLPTRANAETWGSTTSIVVRIYDWPNLPLNEKNNQVSFPVRFAPKPGGSTSPTPSATAASGTSGSAGGGLPITGAATLPLMLGGVVLLLIGGAAVWAARRRTQN